MSTPTTEQLHSKTWANKKTVNAYEKRNAFLDRGEQRGYELLSPELARQPILDLGIGAGRTIPMWTALTSDYVGIDYSSAMVEVAKQRFPERDLRTGDARDLSAFPDGHFQLVMFSHNGIDCVSHDDRQLVLREALRVLKPGGCFFYATLNKDGFGHSFKPWHVPVSASDFTSPRKFVRLVKSVLLVPRRLRNYLQGKKSWHEADGWCMAPISTHDFTLVMHYISLQSALAELRQAGFAADPIVYDCGEGQTLAPTADTKHIFYFQILARKPLAAA